MGRGNSTSNICINKDNARNHHNKDIRGNIPAEGYYLQMGKQGISVLVCYIERHIYRSYFCHQPIECGLFLEDPVRLILLMIVQL